MTSIRTHRRGGGRRPKHPGAVRKIVQLRIPGSLYVDIVRRADLGKIDRVDLIAFYLINGWNQAHPSAPFSIPEYLQQAWESLTPSLIEMEIPTTDIDLDERQTARPRLPEPVHTALSDEAWDAETTMNDLGTAYVLLGRNMHFDDQLEMPTYLEAALQQVTDHERGQGVLLAAV